MSEYGKKAVAVVGMGAIMPDAFSVPAFWNNIKGGKYSITDVPKDRWDPDDYYDPDPTAPFKTYSKLGAWVKGFHFNPLDIGVPIPPKVMAVMDQVQQWAIITSYQALQDYGYPARPLDNNRTAVILGNALAGENHYITTMRIRTPEFLNALASQSEFQSLPGEVQKALLDGIQNSINETMPNITEDTMPGELANIIAGRVANVFNLGGPNFVTDAACASTFAALQASIDGLIFRRFDAVLTGGIDRSMGVEAFVKFCKIGALSPDGSRPYAEGANGFIMGEGAGVFLLKRLEDAERDGDKIYAVIRGIGGSSDGKGKAITAPNPIGQQRAIERAWKDAGMSPAEATYIEGHGTSTRVGDLVELQSMLAVFEPLGVPAGKVTLGSVKSNIGHLKSAAGAAGLLKAIGSINGGVISPTINCQRPNPHFEFSKTPFYVNTEARPWTRPESGVRRAGISSFGFGGTNFHVVIEEYLPGLLTSTKRVFSAVKRKEAPQVLAARPLAEMPLFRGMLFLGAKTQVLLRDSLNATIERIRAGDIPESRHPTREELAKPERLVIDYGNGDELLNKAEKALKAFDSPKPNFWKMLTAQGIFRGGGKPGKVAFLFPGQGSQYVNMLRELRDLSPIVSETFREADEVMQPLLDGRKLTSYIFIDGDEDEIRQAAEKLRDTKITQPAVLTVNVALMRLLESYGFTPDVVVGHSLGEYAALVSAGVLSFADALVVVSSRGRAMNRIKVDDNGCMAAVSAPIEEVENIIADISGYVVIANINSPTQSVIGGETSSVDASVAAFKAAGYEVVKIPVSHAFHTNIVAPARGPLRETIARMSIKSPNLPVIANVTGDNYPTEREEIRDMLAKHVASPVQFVKSMRKLYEMGVRVFLEVGPKRVLTSLANDNLKAYADTSILYSNHPRKGTLPTFNEALCGLYAAGVQPGSHEVLESEVETVGLKDESHPVPSRGLSIEDGRLPLTGSVVISGVGLGLPGREEKVFSDDNFERILNGDMRIEPLPESERAKMLEKRVTRLVKSDAGAEMVLIDDINGTVKLAGQRGVFNLVEEFGVSAERVEALDISAQLAIAAGIEALHDANIPLVMRYRRTSKGTYLPHRWMLPQALADETGVIFASAFPGLDRMSEEAKRFYNHRNLSDQLEMLQQLRSQLSDEQSNYAVELDRRISVLEMKILELDYHFDRRFVFRVLPMGHSQFAEFIGARGPNTNVNAACASTTHAIAVAEDWIRVGRCRRVIIVAGDDITSENLAEWVGTGMLASGAATTNGNVVDAARPFDRRRNGMIMGMGAAALVVEAQDAVEERGVRAICEILASQIANSAFHGTRLDVGHVSDVMDNLLTQAEQRFAIRREEIAPLTMFMSHETYTPARGGSAAAEIRALRQNFGDRASEIIISNTKGFTGHTMGVGVEDVIAAKALQHQVIPPIANITNGFEPDPDLGDLNLSRGGKHSVEYALRLGAGFGSQIALTLLRRIPGEGERVDDRTYQRWLTDYTGYEQIELELVNRTLRIRDDGPPALVPAKSKWQLGQGPTSWAPALAGTVQALKPVGQQSSEVELKPLGVEVETPQQPDQADALATKGERVSVEQVRMHVLGLVSEKTGYPREMLELDLDLEADLGVDTVKQAELLAVVRDTYDIPRRDDLMLSDYNTLAKVIQYVMESLGEVPEEQAEPVLEASEEKVFSEVEIEAHVVGLVSEKTGYPREMLDLDLDLEADLGVDTVKQAELLAAVRDTYDIPRRDDLMLSDYNTLAKVIQYVGDSLNGKKQLAQKTPAEEEQKPAQPEVSEIRVEIPQGGYDSIKRRVPMPILRPRLDVCKDTGISLGPDKRFIVIKDDGAVGESLLRRLRSRKVKVYTLHDPSLEEVIDNVASWSKEGPVHGVFFLPALDVEAPINEMDEDEWNSEIRKRVYVLFTLMRSLPGNVPLISATRMGGTFGYSGSGSSAPFGGAVSGFTKAYSWEAREALVKVVDFAPEMEDRLIAEKLIDETLRDPGAVEIGWDDDLRFSIGMIEQSLPAEKQLILGSDDIFLVTGGAGAITATIVQDLANASRGTFYLADLAPLPDGDDPDLEKFRTDPEALKKELIQRLSSEGKKVTPVMIEKRLFSIERAASIHSLLDGIKKVGGKVFYSACDVTDGAAVSGLVDEIVEAEGKLDYVIHTAGIERSHLLEQKTSDEFRLVFSVKADGIYHLMRAISKHELSPKGVVTFSSIAGRMGNVGQTDYSAANDLFCKLTTALPQQFPNTKFVSMDWGPWADVGMASRGSMPKLMEAAGIEMVKSEIGAQLVRLELEAGGNGGEVLVAGTLGILGEQRDAQGGLDFERANQALTAGDPAHVMLSSVTGFDLHKGIKLEVELDPKTEPFLIDHAMNGISLLPGVMGIEGFSFNAMHVASVLASAGGRFHVAGLEEVKFLAPFKFYKDEPRKLTWQTQVYRINGRFEAHVVLESTRKLKARPEEQVIHFSGRVILVRKPEVAGDVRVTPPEWNGSDAVLAEDIYKLYFHGPAFQVLEGAQRSGDAVIGKLREDLLPITVRDHDLLTAPMLIELCLQTAGVWEVGSTGVMSLPMSVGKIEIHQSKIADVPIFAEVHTLEVNDEKATFNARVVDAKGNLYLEIKDYCTSALPYTISEDLVKPLRNLMK